MNSEGFRVGDFWIEWRDVDTVSITNTRLGRSAIIHGGDLEGMFSGLVESVFLSVREAVQAMPQPTSGFPPLPTGKPPHGVYG